MPDIWTIDTIKSQEIFNQETRTTDWNMLYSEFLGLKKQNIELRRLCNILAIRSDTLALELEKVKSRLDKLESNEKEDDELRIFTIKKSLENWTDADELFI